MFRFLFGLMLIIGAFIAGYFLGEQRVLHVPDKFSGIRSEISDQASRLETTLKGVRLWMALNDTKDHLGLAASALDEKNYGSAVYEVKEAREKLEKAEHLSEGNLKRDLRPLDAIISETETSVLQSNPNAKMKVEEAKKELDKIISR